MIKKVIVFNGPPNSGKDTFCDFLLTQFENSTHVRFKDILYEETAKHYKIELEKFIELATDRVTKEKMLPSTGLTPRQMLIEVSENIIKPEKGEDYFGTALKDTILNGQYEYYFISDSGFVPELEPIVKAINRENLILIKLAREDTSFDNDSRDYIPEDFIDKHMVQNAILYNVGIEDSFKELLNIIKYFFKVDPNTDQSIIEELDKDKTTVKKSDEVKSEEEVIEDESDVESKDESNKVETDESKLDQYKSEEKTNEESNSNENEPDKTDEESKEQ